MKKKGIILGVLICLMFIGLVSILSSFVTAVCINTPGFQCSAQAQTDCNLVSGCNWNEFCSGGLTYCTWAPQDECNSISGCWWYRSQCFPYDTPKVPCSYYNNNELWCGYQREYCSWSSLCQGTPSVSCGGLGQTTCNSRLGCTWSCTPESNGAFCSRLNKNCGSVTANDNCGSSRTVNCGSCTLPNTCQSGQCVCVDEEISITCGSDVCGNKINNCGQSVSCGSCSGGEVCISGVCSANLTGAYWTNMKGDLIDGGSANLNDLVRLNVLGVGLEGENIDYTIKQDIWYWFDKKIAQLSSGGFTTWKANKTGSFYFEAVLESRDDKVNSDNLIVLDIPDNSNPVAKITGPEDRQIYFIGTDLEFTQDSYDEDDEFTYEWDLGDGRKFIGNSTLLNNWSFTKSYTTPGQKDIILNVSDGRNGVGRDKISILILDSVDNTQTLAYIDSPKWGLAYGRTVLLNASGSYTAEYNGGVAKCLAGNCPNPTKNCPGDSFGVCTIDVDESPKDYNDLSFLWDITNGISGSTTSQPADAPTRSWSFSTPSVPSKPHKVRLTVDYSE